MKAWTVVVSAVDGSNNAKTLRFSDNKYIDAAKNKYIKRLAQPAVIDVSPTDGGVLRLFETPARGEIELINNDGALNYLNDYAFDGRTLTHAYMDGATVVKSYTFTALGLSERNGRLFISLRTLQDTLDTEHPLDTYAGTNSLPNGVEGTANDIKGNPKPKAFGDVRNVTPVLVNSSKLIYQACSRSTSVVGGAFDNRAALTRVTPDYADVVAMEATAPAAGYYRCYKGLFRLGANPIGEITCDVSQSANGAGDVLEAILAERSASLNSASKTMLNAIGDIGIYVDSTVTTWSLIEQIARSTLTFIYVEAGAVYAKKLDLTQTPIWPLQKHHIQRIERKSIGVSENGLPVYSIEMQADFIQTVQKLLDGTVVPMADIARYKEQSRKVVSSDSGTLTRHPLSKPLKIDSALRSLSDAQAICDDFLDIIKVRRDRVSLDVAYVESDAFAGIDNFSMGDVITVYNDDLDYSAGRNMAIIGFRPDSARNKMTLELFG